jgi:hypothetical protein
MSKQKNPVENNLRKNFPIKPFYTTSELKCIVGYNTNRGTISFLKKLNIPYKLLGRNHYWFLSDIQTHSPELFSSICECANLTSLIQTQPIMEVDEDFYSTQQFK